MGSGATGESKGKGKCSFYERGSFASILDGLDDGRTHFAPSLDDGRARNVGVEFGSGQYHLLIDGRRSGSITQ